MFAAMYGWTPAQVAELTMPQAMALLGDTKSMAAGLTGGGLPGLPQPGLRKRVGSMAEALLEAKRRRQGK